MSKSIKTSDLFNVKTPYLINLFSSYEYAYEIVKNIGDYILKIIPTLTEFTQLKEGVYIGKNVKIYSGVIIEPPAVIGHGTVLRVGAFIRGNVITGENCVIGNSSELKNCVLLNNVQVPHYNYVGDSVLGNNTHLGAGTVCSNLKLDGSNVILRLDKEYSTNMRKLGAILGDNANVGSCSILNPGTVLGKNSVAYSGLTLRGIYDSDVIIKPNEIIKKE
ncbi:MAG: UDP-N-acetylglucosamine pyrophosphorylase [Clostridia bacterium]|nr:UDP-N-acetylglucosamine pyrophosphorylase [Clostridia bacterium]